MKNILIACASFAALTVAVSAVQGATIYQSDFGSGLSGFTTTGGAGLRTNNGITYLGGLTLGATGAVSIDVSAYSGLSVSFDLYAIQSLDGDGPSGGGADPFLVAQGSTILFNYTFANYSGAASQSYPNPGSAPKSGAYTTNLLGYGTGDFGDSEYHIAPIALTSVNGVTTLTFTGNSGQAEGDESYGINNIVVSGTRNTTPGMVPEPASWAMMISGFGLVGAAMRRRKAVVAFA